MLGVRCQGVGQVSGIGRCQDFEKVMLNEVKHPGICSKKMPRSFAVAQDDTLLLFGTGKETLKPFPWTSVT